MQSQQSFSNKKPGPVLLILVLTGLPLISLAGPTDTLGLEEAEQIAIQLDPVAKKFMVRAEAYSELAVAEGQLPDPKLKVGMMNLPADSFDRSDEAMTQLQLGLTQAFPRGRTLDFRQEHSEALADLETARGLERSLKVLREVRIQYLELFYQSQSEKILQRNRELFAELLSTTQRQYATGRDNQHDVLRAQLELSLVDDRILEVTRVKEAVIGNLAKYLASEQSQRPIADEFPTLRSIPPEGEIRERLVLHPLIVIEDAAVMASKKKIGEAEQQYKPGFSVDLTYGNRTGNFSNGSNRPDMLSAMVMVDLPIFTGKRQDKRLSAAVKQSTASQYARTDRLYELGSMLDREQSNWKRFSDRLSLYEQRAISDARLNAESTLKAYQNDIADFTTLMRAQLTELDTQLVMLRVRIERAKVQARLLYLAGEL